ncbi:MAG: hypothetical protein K2X43_20720 [Hyphomonadaceae bacterium]|jgi:hypothetical protein|nr:hypothetical protein [Hyphomonadaceae bacterium]
MSRKSLAIHWMEAAAVAFFLLLVSLALAGPGAAQTVNLAGTWSGGGSVSFASGQRERARCRAQYSRTSPTSYALRATCATASGRASQTATIRHVGGNRYQGNFYNREYDVSGTIHVAVGGNRQTVRLSSGVGSAVFELHR